MNIYIGNYIEVIEHFHKTAGVQIVVSEKRNVDDRIKQFCEKSDVQLYLTETGEDLHEFLLQIGEIDLCIVASFGFLLNQEFIQKVKWLVNIHPGSLVTCRGRHPLPFAIKKGLPFMTLTAHLILDESIDNGPIIAEMNLPLNYDQSYSDNEKRLRKCLKYLTEIITDQYLKKSHIHANFIDLSKAIYNERLSGEELKKMMNAVNLLEYKL